MKSHAEISNRLNKLLYRYLANYIKQTQARIHSNCVFNLEHKPKKLTISHQDNVEFSFSPRKTNSLIVIQSNTPPNSVYICTYGMPNSGWNGDICDSTNNVASHCKWFQSKVSKLELESEFNELLKDDDYVLKNYPDIAALQWVLNERIRLTGSSIWDRITLFFLMIWPAHKPKEKLLTEGTPTPVEDVPADLWQDDT